MFLERVSEQLILKFHERSNSHCFRLREIAFVEVDEANIILKFKVDDGSVEFSGDPSFSAKMRALWFHRKSVGVMNSTIEIENEESENNDTELADEHE